MTDRIEQAAPDVREVLMNAAFEIADGNWSMAQTTRFTRFLDAEAYTDAALMLVTEGALLRVHGCTNRNGFNAWINIHQVGNEKDVFGNGKTPALAIAAASLRAKGPGHE